MCGFVVGERGRARIRQLSGRVKADKIGAGGLWQWLDQAIGAGRQKQEAGQFDDQQDSAKEEDPATPQQMAGGPN